jgi:hypothetical protein|nr:MAG TPA: Major head protein [Caudoviricetes sp.]
MLKSELLELVEKVDDNTDIDDIIFNSFMNMENIKRNLDSNKDFKSKYDAEVSEKINTAISNFKTKDMQKLIDAEVLKRTNNPETPEQKQIRELKERLDAADKKNARTEMISKYKDILAAKNIPSEMVDFLLGDDDDVTNANIALFENNMKNYIETQVKERMSKGSYKPPVPSGGTSGKITWAQVQENPEGLYEKWVAQEESNSK